MIEASMKSQELEVYFCDATTIICQHMRLFVGRSWLYHRMLMEINQRNQLARNSKNWVEAVYCIDKASQLSITESFKSSSMKTVNRMAQNCLNRSPKS